MVTAALAPQWVSSFELEQEGSGLETIYGATVLGLRLRLNRSLVALRSLCCGEPLFAWQEEWEEAWACGACDEDSPWATEVPDRAEVAAVAPATLEAWARAAGTLSPDPLLATLEAAEAFSELSDAFFEAFGHRLGAEWWGGTK